MACGLQRRCRKEGGRATSPSPPPAPLPVLGEPTPQPYLLVNVQSTKFFLLEVSAASDPDQLEGHGYPPSPQRGENKDQVKMLGNYNRRL